MELATPDDLFQELDGLYQRQQANWSEYISILNHAQEALTRHVTDDFAEYRAMESATLEKILSGQAALAQLADLRLFSPEKASRLEEYRAHCETLRQEALAANTKIQELLGQEMGSVRQEIAGTTARLARVGKEHYSGGDDPQFIDYLS